MPWRDVSSSPHAPEVLAMRRAALADAWQPFDGTRLELLERECRGLRVVDIGCTDEGLGAAALHEFLVDVASQCVGVDRDEPGIASMTSRGYDVVIADVCSEVPESLLAMGPFDRVVAGELIEHLDAPGDLFRFARPLLADDGRLLITTPNPYALHRVFAGWARLVWENSDHVAYLFPAGIVELAERYGLRLSWFTTVQIPGWDPGENVWRSVRRFLAAKLRRAPLPPWYVPPYIPLLYWRQRPMMQETMVYCVVPDSS